MTEPPIFSDLTSFRTWADGMDEAFGAFQRGLPAETRIALDFSVHSLDALEAWLLGRFVDYRELLLAENRVAYDGSARYFGEVLRRSVDGEWAPCLEDERSASFGHPTIEGYPRRTARIMPHFCITATIDRRRGTYLSSIVERTLETLG